MGGGCDRALRNCFLVLPRTDSAPLAITKRGTVGFGKGEDDECERLFFGDDAGEIDGASAGDG